MRDKTNKIIVVGIAIAVVLFVFFGITHFIQRSQMTQGVEYLQDGEYQKAYEELDKAASKPSFGYTKQKVNTLYFEAEALYRLERYDDAIAIYDDILDHKEASYGYAMKALCYMGLKKEGKAIETCNQGIENCSDEGASYDMKISILMKQKKYKQGLKVVKKALAQDLSSGKKDIMFDQISLYEAKLDYKKAYNYAKKYVKAYPKDKKGKKELTFLKSRI